MKTYPISLFVPFNVRNNMIADLKIDINEVKPAKQYQTLLSFMPKEDIFRGLQKFSKAKADFNVRKI